MVIFDINIASNSFCTCGNGRGVYYWWLYTINFGIALLPIQSTKRGLVACCSNTTKIGEFNQLWLMFSEDTNQIFGESESVKLSWLMVGEFTKPTWAGIVADNFGWGNIPSSQPLCYFWLGWELSRGLREFDPQLGVAKDLFGWAGDFGFFFFGRRSDCNVANVHVQVFQFYQLESQIVLVRSRSLMKFACIHIFACRSTTSCVDLLSYARGKAKTINHAPFWSWNPGRVLWLTIFLWLYWLTPKHCWASLPG